MNADQERGREEFTARDVDLLVSVLRANDSMQNAALAVKLIESVCRYPLGSFDALEPVMRTYGRSGALRVGGCSITRDQASRYLPSEQFPIEDREALISRLLLAFETARWDQLTEVMRTQATSSRGEG